MSGITEGTSVVMEIRLLNDVGADPITVQGNFGVADMENLKGLRGFPFAIGVHTCRFSAEIE